MAEPETGGGGGGGGGGMGRKIGPLPAWGWAVLLGGLGGIIYFLRRSQASASQSDSGNGAGTSDDAEEPTTIVPVNQGLSEQQAQDILDAIKALQGDESEEKPPPTTTLPAPNPKPGPQPKDPTHKVPTPPKPKPKPKTITVVKWHPSPHTPWNSTLWGIAQHEHVKGGWQALQRLNHLKGDPKKALKPGMKIKLPS